MSSHSVSLGIALLSVAVLAACSDRESGSGSSTASTPVESAAASPASAEKTVPGSEQPAPPAQPAQPGWTVLLDGTSLEGWQPIGDANWQVVDGAVQADSGSGFLVSNESYGDFELELEFWGDATANSGVFLRCADPSEVTAKNAYEVNIFDQRPDQTYRTGGIVDVAPPARVIDTAGRWNTYAIAARGKRLTVTLNGTPTVDTEDERLPRGPIALQHGAGTIKFRNLRIHPL